MVPVPDLVATQMIRRVAALKRRKAVFVPLTPSVALWPGMRTAQPLPRMYAWVVAVMGSALKGKPVRPVARIVDAARERLVSILFVRPTAGMTPAKRMKPVRPVLKIVDRAQALVALPTRPQVVFSRQSQIVCVIRASNAARKSGI